MDVNRWHSLDSALRIYKWIPTHLPIRHHTTYGGI